MQIEALAHPGAAAPEESRFPQGAGGRVEKGYTSGVAADRFGSGQPVTAVEYEEFLLRALGYSVAGANTSCEM